GRRGIGPGCRDAVTHPAPALPDCGGARCPTIVRAEFVQALSQRTDQGGESDLRSQSGAHPVALEPLELRRHRSSGARISDARKGTKTCRNFTSRCFATLLWLSVLVGQPEMRG